MALAAALYGIGDVSSHTDYLGALKIFKKSKHNTKRIEVKQFVTNHAL